jgi:hypothetical protein
LKLFGEFGMDGFAGNGDASGGTGCLNALMRIPEPAYCGKQDVRVENSPVNAIYDS